MAADNSSYNQIFTTSTSTTTSDPLSTTTEEQEGTTLPMQEQSGDVESSLRELFRRFRQLGEQKGTFITFCFMTVTYSLVQKMSSEFLFNEKTTFMRCSSETNKQREGQVDPPLPENKGGQRAG